jgi:rare lipoprotein A
MPKYVTILLFCVGFLALGFTRPINDSSLANPTLLRDSSDTLQFDSILEIDTISMVLQDSITISFDTISLANGGIEIFSVNSTKFGTASYYHDKFVGRKTANGAIFSQKKMTCAHRTIPLGSKVRVTNLDNGKTVILTVNDRMGKSQHEIDLTSSAAKKLGFIHAGWANVQIDVLKKKKK